MKRVLAVIVTAALALGLLAGISAAQSEGTGSARPDIPGYLTALSGTDGFDGHGRDFDILLEAAATADLVDALKGDDLALFAPVDNAFIRLAQDLGYTGSDEAGTWSFLVAAFTSIGGGDPIPVLTNVLLYHVSTDLDLYNVVASDEIETLLPGATFGQRNLVLEDNDPDLKDPRIVRKFEYPASNGSIFPISRPLIPVDL